MSASVVAELSRLNTLWIDSDNAHDGEAFSEELLADDFFMTMPNLSFVTKAEYVRIMNGPRAYSQLTSYDVHIRVLSADFAIVHSKTTFRAEDGKTQQGRYTDDYQLIGGRWQCVSATVVAPSRSNPN